MKNDKTYLEHIYDAVNRIEKYLGESTFEQFCNNDMMIAATVRELGIIGEASNKLTEEFRQKHQSVSFRDASDMRNFLIHEYFGVNTKIVWQTCKNDLPELKDFIVKSLNE